MFRCSIWPDWLLDANWPESASGCRSDGRPLAADVAWSLLPPSRLSF